MERNNITRNRYVCKIRLNSTECYNLDVVKKSIKILKRCKINFLLSYFVYNDNSSLVPFGK